MIKKTLPLLALLAMVGCSTPQPKIIQATSGSPDIHLTVGMATQVEMPGEGRVQSIVVGNPALVSAEQSSDVVNLLAKGEAGETNLIIRFRDNDNAVKVYQYRVIVQQP